MTEAPMPTRDDRLEALARRVIRLSPDRNAEVFVIEKQEIAEEIRAMRDRG